MAYPSGKCAPLTICPIGHFGKDTWQSTRPSPSELLDHSFHFFFLLSGIPLWKVYIFNHISLKPFREGYLRAYHSEKCAPSTFCLSGHFGKDNWQFIGPPHTCMITPLFFYFILFLKSAIPLWKMCTFNHLSLGPFQEGYLRIQYATTADLRDHSPHFIFFKFFF